MRFFYNSILILAIITVTSCSSYKMSDVVSYETKPGVPQGTSGFYLQFNFKASKPFKPVSVQQSNTIYEQFFIENLETNNITAPDKLFNAGFYSIYFKLRDEQQVIPVNTNIIFNYINSSGVSINSTQPVMRTFVKQLR